MNMTIFITGIWFLLISYPDIITLNVEPIVRDAIITDINADGRKDIVFLISEEDGYKKKIIIYLQREEPALFGNNPSNIFDINEPCSIVFISKCEGKPCIVFGNCDSFYIYDYQQGEIKLKTTINIVNSFPCNAKEPLVFREICFDLDNDGDNEWFVPTPHGITIVKNLKILTSLPLNLFHEIIPGNNLTSFYQYPGVYPLNKSAENPKPIAFLGNKEIIIAHGEKWSSNYKFEIQHKNPEKWDVSYRLGDVNGDGVPDILFTETQGTINLKTTVFMYISTGKYEYPEQPQFEYKIKGSMCLPMIKDINNDTKDDLILFSIPLGLTNFINFFIRGKLSVDTKVFLAKENGFLPKPDYQTSITMDAPEGRDQVAYAVDDFSGDGLMDIAFGQSQNTIAVNIATQEGSLKTKSWLRVDVPGFGLIRTGKINENANKDIVLFRPTGENKARVDVIIF
ncbi:MAG TPA: hypothetical protein PLT82_10765 [Candidatus Hydrogenedens sp.]|nr:hypothetical protein [Candidatus Hydrogenedens sp.]HOL19977.1 hypothetical protein [Candidatus Hydrogenedens sp.]HPP59603.1 hypothetical protein [Candidatus Hydrogenedens sp.]